VHDHSSHPGEGPSTRLVVTPVSSSGVARRWVVEVEAAGAVECFFGVPTGVRWVGRRVRSRRGWRGGSRKARNCWPSRRSAAEQGQAVPSGRCRRQYGALTPVADSQVGQLGPSFAGWREISQ